MAPFVSKEEKLTTGHFGNLVALDWIQTGFQLSIALLSTQLKSP